MIPNNYKTSLLISSQLPEYIRENPDYSNFVLFLQAYYEWMEQSGNVTDVSKGLTNDFDIDNTSSEFLNYFINDFLPYFPEDALISKQKAVKVARELYQSKGTLASYKFLFRILYNSDFQVELTKDSVLRASAGKWYVAKSLRLATLDKNFLNINNYRLFGQTSKSIATVENAIVSGNKTEVFISNIERLFQSGETVSVVDNFNQPVYFYNGNVVSANTAGAETLSATIVGQISQININPNYRGLLYNPGDPVIVYGGLNPNITNPVGAVAAIGTTTTGSIQNISVVNGGIGYTVFPNSFINITNSNGANAVIASVNTDPHLTSNVSIAIDTIAYKQYITIGNSNYHFANIAVSNANTTLANALTFENFSTYPISSVVLINGGGNISQVPQITAESTYTNDQGLLEDLSGLGILGPITIVNGGHSYNVNDTIVFSGATGYGAAANVTSVNANGAITSVSYVPAYGITLGGLGYNSLNLPTLNVHSTNANAGGAVLVVSGILGTGATFNSKVTQIGSINTINIVDPGEDYVSAPSVSLRVQDIIVSNTTIYNLPQNGDIVFQGPSLLAATYTANVYSTKIVQSNNLSPTGSLYQLRVYNYTTQPDPTKTLNIVNKSIHLTMANTAYAANTFYIGSPAFNANGIKNYGDGTAKATASFLNGLVLSQGQYLDTTGQPSSFSVLQSENYNNFTYKITVQKEIAKYRNILLNLLHPSGTKLIGRYAMKSNNGLHFVMSDALFKGKTLQSYTGDSASVITINTNFTNQSNNVIVFQNLGGALINTFMFTGIVGQPNTMLQITTPHGPNVKSEVIAIDVANNLVTIKDSPWLTFNNVAYAQATTGNTNIHINQLTGLYNIINNGMYSNTSYPLMDIVYTGDKVQLSGNTYIVSSVDYINGIINTTTSILSNTSNSLLSVNRTYTTGNVKILGPIGIEYIPQLLTEDGINLITTEDGNIIILES